ncbi:MAG: hypothetical protein PVI06_09640 [Desulfobacterales bacterium]
MLTSLAGIQLKIRRFSRTKQDNQTASGFLRRMCVIFQGYVQMEYFNIYQPLLEMVYQVPRMSVKTDKAATAAAVIRRV